MFTLHATAVLEGEQSCEQSSQELEASANDQASSPHPSLEHSSDLAPADHFLYPLSAAQLSKAAVVFRWIKHSPGQAAGTWAAATQKSKAD